MVLVKNNREVQERDLEDSMKEFPDSLISY